MPKEPAVAGAYSRDMATRAIGVVAAAVMAASTTAFAQISGLSSASLPSRPEISVAPTAAQIHSLPHDSRDLFRAGPDTYAPGRHQQPYFFPWYPPYYYPSLATESFWDRPLAARTEPGRLKPAPTSEGPSARSQSVVGAGFSRPAMPRTFYVYVIPGCYAGDRPPVPEVLPRGCDPTKLRIVPPVHNFAP